MENLGLKQFYKDKRVLVTGHTGFKGGWLVCMLNKLGANVCGYGLKPNTNPNLFSLIGAKNFVNHVEGDIRDFKKLKKVFLKFKPEIVFHLAAQPIVLESYNNPKDTYDINVMGTVNVLEAIRTTNSVRSFVNVTTDKVYFNNDSGKAFVETDKLCGFDPYSNSKSCSEMVTFSYQNSFFNAKDFEKHKVAISTCRAGNVIGGGDWAKYRLVPDCVRSLIKGEAIEIRNPYSTRPFQHVLEPLYMYLKIAMMQYDNPKYMGNYNIGPDIENCISAEELVKLFVKHQKTAKYVVKQAPNCFHEASKLTLDNSKIKQVFGYKPTYDMDKTIKTIVDWTDAFINGKDMRLVTERQIDEFLNLVEK